MKKTTIKKIIMSSGLLLSCLILGFFLFSSPKDVRANASVVSITTNATSTVGSLATTTAEAPFLQSTAATSTVQFDPQNGDIIQLSLAVYSTSTAPVMSVGLETSNNGIDWYSFEESPAAGNPTTLIVGKPTNTWRWSAATTTADETVFKSFVLTNLFVSKYGRVLLKANGAGATVHAEIAVKKQY